MLLDRNLHIHLKQTPILQEKTNAGNRRNCHIDKKKQIESSMVESGIKI